ncbi:hypothetical protein [Pseudoxanthomonas koreensis]|uniref:hypothetical protein n=1 Tax=Pseudoxanthomonas koreensis TaxID=266061 RepID=UPI0013917458|nr:hypothetical protein [Pseudoxanthomonas koreensis]
MRELSIDDLHAVSGGLEKCEMSTATKVELTVITVISPLIGLAAIAAYYANRDC